MTESTHERAYEPPALEELGTLGVMTQGGLGLFGDFLIGQSSSGGIGGGPGNIVGGGSV